MSNHLKRIRTPTPRLKPPIPPGPMNKNINTPQLTIHHLSHLSNPLNPTKIRSTDKSPRNPGPLQHFFPPPDQQNPIPTGSENPSHRKPDPSPTTTDHNITSHEGNPTDHTSKGTLV